MTGGQARVSAQTTDSARVTVQLDEGLFLEIEERRDQWQSKIDFLLACIGFSVGLGNVWRFPYLCYKNGGGAFLIPYFLFAAVCGLPLFVLEVSIGQLMSRGGIEAWDIVPICKGIGYASIGILFLLNSYYNVIIAWCLHFLFSSMRAVLPWSGCDNEWNSADCRVAANSTASMDTTYYDPSKEYWELRVLRISKGLEEPGEIVWELALCLLLAWIIVYLCIIQGIKSSRMVMYFTAPFPYLVLLVLIVRTAMLKGSLDGVAFYLTPDLEKLRDIQVWTDAGTQIFFTYSISLGTLTALGSYNQFHHNSFRDCVAFSLVNSITSFLAGFVIFSTLGYMAHETGVSISAVASGGPGLTFMVYPKALSTMPLAPFWSCLFFVMLLFLGINTQFVGVEGLMTGLTDIWPRIYQSRLKKSLFTLFMCMTMFVLGLSMVTQCGIYIFQIFDYCIGSRIVILVGSIECIVVVYVYGGFRFVRNLETMYQFRLGKLFLGLWGFVTPALTMSIFVMSMIVSNRLEYERAASPGKYLLPWWAVMIGWTLAFTCVAAIPVLSLYKVFMAPGASLKEKIRFSLQPCFRPDVARRLNVGDQLVTAAENK